MNVSSVARFNLGREKNDGAPINAIGSTANPEYPRGFRNAGDLHSVAIPIPLTRAFCSPLSLSHVIGMTKINAVDCWVVHMRDFRGCQRENER